MSVSDGRGVLYPSRLPPFHRQAVPEGLAHLLRWVWLPRWDLPAGERLVQEALPFPASNLVVEPAGTSLRGPTTGVSTRVLEGRGWAVGALLRPAGLSGLGIEPASIRDSGCPLLDAALHGGVVEAMGCADPDEGRRQAAALMIAWLSERAGAPDDAALSANDVEDLVAGDRSIVRVEQLAQRLGMSVRGVQRLTQRYIGLAPLAVIRRYRLQEAALRLREEPGYSIAEVAADLGYADQAHLSGDFRKVLGLSPGAYRDRHD